MNVAALVRLCFRRPQVLVITSSNVLSKSISPTAHCKKLSANSRLFATSCYRQSAFEDRDTKALTVWHSVKEVKKSPVPALSLGFLGLIPFVGCPLLMVSTGAFMTQVALAQGAYGACILSFLGGIRWGFTLPAENPVQPDWVNLGYSVTPSLVAWAGLLLPSPTLTLGAVMGGLVMAGYVDMAMYGYPTWFKGMRFLLTLVAVLSLWTTLTCYVIMPAENGKVSEK
ncbi:hypothetical protein CAPTEDRAFT_160077 [Capitella teleta]|uniref:Transmembrane protein 69 n=1 Tax=Capitella teleta TaxID=283909 RepID=R7TM69_CAPTE|nr:hypothetical protein CAPTEDRAFT_160077 [Capitella teleta]|eukprot:ELT94632.1 hypothetical protein CAPTEDRAFT_160077 [Capitella teleta]